MKIIISHSHPHLMTLPWLIRQIETTTMKKKKSKQKNKKDHASSNKKKKRKVHTTKTSVRA